MRIHSILPPGKQVAVLGLLCAFVLTSIAGGEPPRSISYQGVLEDDQGAPVPDGDYELTFRIYDVESGATPIWIEVQTLPVTSGIFNAILGDATPIDLDFDVPYWLTISIEGGPELTPRTQLASAPYAFRAICADSVAGGGGGPDGDWTIVGDDMYAAVPGNVGIGTTSPAPAALLDLESSEKGFLPPRLSEVERDAIVAPPDGLMIFNTTTGCVNYYFNGWLELCGQCVPDCEGYECGDDGCGGTCGTCPTGMHCVNHLCVCDIDECDAGETMCESVPGGGYVFKYCEEDVNGCGQWVSIDCDDDDPCTVDTCDPVTGCINTPLSNPGGTSCGNSTNHGTICGDTGGSTIMTSGCLSGFTSSWHRVTLNECQSVNMADLKIHFRFTLNPGNAYRMDVYKGGCPGVGTSPCSGGLGQTEAYDVIEDIFGSNDSEVYYVRVYLATGVPVGVFNLLIEGNAPVTCP